MAILNDSVHELGETTGSNQCQAALSGVSFAEMMERVKKVAPKNSDIL